MSHTCKCRFEYSAVHCARRREGEPLAPPLPRHAAVTGADGAADAAGGAGLPTARHRLRHRRLRALRRHAARAQASPRNTHVPALPATHATSHHVHAHAQHARAHEHTQSTKHTQSTRTRTRTHTHTIAHTRTHSNTRAGPTVPSSCSCCSRWRRLACRAGSSACCRARCSPWTACPCVWCCCSC